MSVLLIEPTPTSPRVDFDTEANRFSIKGRSMPEDSDKFYGTLKEWLVRNLHGKRVKAVMDIALDYYNTGSFIRLMEIFNLLAELNGAGHSLGVNWHYDVDDQDTHDDGLAFKDVVKVPFELVPSNG